LRPRPFVAVIPKPRVLSSGARDLACTGTAGAPAFSRPLREAGAFDLERPIHAKQRVPHFSRPLRKVGADAASGESCLKLTFADAHVDVGVALCGAGTPARCAFDVDQSQKELSSRGGHRKTFAPRRSCFARRGISTTTNPAAPIHNSPCHSLSPNVKRNPTVRGSRPRRGPFFCAA
jgi:hypothetical protein